MLIFYYTHLVEKTDNTFRQQLRKGDYENVQWIEKEVEKVMIPPVYTAFHQTFFLLEHRTIQIDKLTKILIAKPLTYRDNAFVILTLSLENVSRMESTTSNLHALNTSSVWCDHI